MKAKYQFEIKNGEMKEQLNIEAKSYAEAFRQFWNHFMATDLIKTIETVDLAAIRTSESEFFVAVNGQKKKNIMLTPTLWIYTHLTPKAMEKAYEKFMKGWNGEITAPLDDVSAVPETNDDLSVINTAIDQEIEMLNAQTVSEPEPDMEHEPEPELEPEAEVAEPVKKLTPKEEQKLKLQAFQAAQREEKRKKKEAAAARKLAKQQAQQQQESQEQEEMELPEM